MSTRFNFLIFLLIFGLKVCFTFRLIEGPVYLKTCPASNRDSQFEDLSPNEQKKHFYNVENLPNDQQPNIIPKEKWTDNWLMRIVKIRTITEKPKTESSSGVQDNHMNGLLHRIFRVLHLRPRIDNLSENDNNERKMVVFLRKDPPAIDHHIVKRDPLPFSYMG
ncbi:hypothetical protein KR074_009139 [Drosophila pseudoananassae]|nr:hypothetical protein KR074_009139 [Drosophila pseudoananassae]